MGSNKIDLSIGMGKTNLILIPFMIACYGMMVGLYYLVWGTYDSEGFFDGIVFWILLVTGIIIHEAIHGITWSIVGKIPKDQIKYGFQWKTLTPYAHSKVPMQKRAYKIGAAMPGFLLGILPFLIGLGIGNSWVFYFGVIFTIAAGGDALILWLIRNVAPNDLVEDHHTRAGCYVIQNQIT